MRAATGARQARPVMVSLGNSSPSDGGLFEFSSQMGRRLAAVAEHWHEAHGVSFHFHMQEALHGAFGPASPFLQYLPLSARQRCVHRTAQPFALWHSTHQLNKFLPPKGCQARWVTVHDLNFLHEARPLSAWRKSRRLHRLVSRADGLVAISAHTGADIRGHLGWTGPLQVIHNGARNAVGHAQEPLQGLDPQVPFLLHLSRMTAAKNPSAILGLAARWPQMQFVMCGAAHADAKALAAANRLPNVQFHLGISEAQKAWAYAHCAGFLFPSLTEGFGLPPIEAMHFGKPVFLSTLTCLPEVGGQAAHYFNTGFEPAAMQQVVEQGLAAHRLGGPATEQRIREHAAQFNWDKAGQAYLALYAQLLGLPPG